MQGLAWNVSHCGSSGVCERERPCPLPTWPAAALMLLPGSMPSAQIARLPAFISRPRASDIAISPDSFQEWPFSRAQTTALALDPPGPAFIEHMVGWLKAFQPRALLERCSASVCATEQLAFSLACNNAFGLQLTRQHLWTCRNSPSGARNRTSASLTCSLSRGCSRGRFVVQQLQCNKLYCCGSNLGSNMNSPD